MPFNHTEDLINFRNALYALFPKRKDAIMNLLDALSSHGQHCKSVVELSLSPFFERQYSSITDAIVDGLSEANWQVMTKLAYQTARPSNSTELHRFILDCTGNPRPHARTLSDRHITHTPNPAPGNKPIAVGHQYSVLSSIPTGVAASKKHWLMPVSALRVRSDQKGHEAGMTQMTDAIESLELADALSLSIGDSLYSTENCRITAATQPNLIHLFRLNSKRNVFFPPEACQDGPTKAGRKQEFGVKMNLGNADTHLPCHQSTTTSWTSRQGKHYTVKINAWNNLLLRGSRKFRSSQHPLNVIRIEVVNDNGKALYKRPLWLGVFGARRHEISLTQIYENYRARYDIEHFFRFSKRNLLLDSYQTAELSHEEAWWSLCLLAYAQLYLAKESVPLLPQPWERYLPEYKNRDHAQKETIVATPSQTQRGFSTVLKAIGTPASSCVTRGKPPGRMIGDIQEKREPQAVIFKAKKAEKKSSKAILSTSGEASHCSDPKTIDALITVVQTHLEKMKISPSKFSKMLIDST